MRLSYILPAALAAAALALYAGVMDYPFLFDGIKGIEKNRAIRSPFDLQTVWAVNPSRFLAFESFALNYWAGGLNPFGYHLVNNILHAANVLLVYRLIGLLMVSSSAGEARLMDPWAAQAARFSAALIFAVHPLQTEAVTYVWQRCSLMVTMFYLLSMVFYLKSAMAERAPEGGGKNPLAYLALSFICALAAMFTKQTAVTLPVALALMDYFFISGLSFAKFRERILRLAPFIPLLLVVPFLTLFYNSGEITDVWRVSKQVLRPWIYLLTQFNVLILYLKLFFYPAELNLDYDFPIAGSFMDSAGSFLILLAILLGGLILSSRSRMGGFGVLFFFLAHSVESSVYPIIDVIFEHRMYMPMTGLLIFFAWAIPASALYLGSAGARALAVLSLIAAVPLGSSAMERNRVWESGVTLWEDVIAKSPNKSRGYINMMVIHRINGGQEAAEKYLQLALTVDPSIAEGFHDMGLYRKLKGDLEGAERNFKKALELDPKRKFTRLELGELYFQQGLYNQAGEQFVKAINTDNQFWEAFKRLGRTLLAMEDWEKAQRLYEKLLVKLPGDPAAPSALANIHLRAGDAQKAEHYRRMAGEIELKRGFKPALPEEEKAPEARGER